MKLLFILDDTSFYHPQFLGDLIKRLKEDTIYVGLVRKIPKKSNLSLYLLKSIHLLKIDELFKLFYNSLRNKILSLFSKGMRFYSLKNVVDFYNLEHFYIYESINTKKYLNKIKTLKPDIIVSSNSLYFGKKLLSIPTKFCINRHSSLLPSYGGLWPVFQAMRNGEKFIGSSIHIMTNDIDEGIILAQEGFKIKNDESVAQVYEKCFNLSVELTIQALDKIRHDNIIGIKNNFKKSYFSFPKESHWKDLRILKKKFI